MSPGATFERVYTELKRQLRAGTRPPGTPLEPTAIGDELGTSFTPVRDALHRLVGEGLVENPKHNGFSVPRPTEQALRDLYAFNGDLLALCLSRQMREQSLTVPNFDRDDVTARYEELFVFLASGTDNREHLRTMTQLNDRLAPYRRAEVAVLPDVAMEFVGVRLAIVGQSAAEMRRVLTSYHKRRISLAPRILDSMATNASSTTTE